MIHALIVGSGPAGLLAAHGAGIEGAAVTIYDAAPEYRPDTIFSLQYLHEPCGLELLVRQLQLRYYCIARSSKPVEVARAYNAKLGRPLDDANSTRFLFESPVTVWSLKDAYRLLWSMYRHRIFQKAVSWEGLLAITKAFDVVISTAPLPKLLPHLDWPTRNSMIAMGWLPVPGMEENTCYYNLLPDVPWYRATYLDGGSATEFVQSVLQESVDGMGSCCARLQPLRKVVQHNNVIGPMPGNLWLTGRWGSWDPSKLTHHAHQDAREAVRIAKGAVRTTS
jgi:hypothetical protein